MSLNLIVVLDSFEVVFDDHGGGVLPTVIKGFDVFHLQLLSNVR